MLFFFFFQAEDGIRSLVRSRGLGGVYKRPCQGSARVVLGGTRVVLGLSLIHIGRCRRIERCRLRWSRHLKKKKNPVAQFLWHSDPLAPYQPLTITVIHILLF